jgi:Asp-tRNA(Asn)/Glu-tRNA(Gln) amidotransferase A subunit family amidase
LPVGLQLVGPRFSEPLLLALVSAYQRETAHHTTRPPT